MIIEGVKLTLLGMVVVFSFLILLILTVKLSAVILKDFTAKEAAQAMSRGRRKTLTSLEEDRKRIAIITAAIAAHRARYRYCQTFPNM